MSSQISITLPGYECQLGESGALHSQLKVRSAAIDLAQIGVNEQSVHTIPSIENETLNYRCSCSFQIVSLENNLRYAMRSKQIAVPLGADFFPIATPRIQEVMKKILCQINLTDEGKFNQTLKGSLASASFASSWNEQKDCIVTLNFNSPIHNRETSEISELREWGDSLCQECQITTLILRSKKMVLNVGRFPPFIDDTIHIRTKHNDESIQICIESPEETSNSSKQSLIPIFYRKPEDAFQHPNSNTMAQALSWMLNTLKEITKEPKICVTKKHLMLEMYCGSGAHTMAISKSKIFEAIIAVEIDRRLVDALKVNSTLNDCNPEDGKDGDNTPVYIFQSDASEWASKSTLYRGRNPSIEDANKMTKKYWFAQDYEVLLVDPPRSGLGYLINFVKMSNRPPCADFTTKVLRCHREYGKLGEDCVREELEQKKCFAQLLCRKEARRFYNDKLVPLSNARWSFGGAGNASKVSCSTIVEVFAKPENGMLMPESISSDDRKFCRKITHELARCLAKKRRQS